MEFQAQDFNQLIGTPGFSETLLTNHFTLYQGYVKNTNTALSLLDGMLKEGATGTPQYAELTRRFGWEFNGMRLHELYFGNMAKAGGTLETQQQLAAKVESEFGSLANWEKDFRAISAMRGIGWAILYHDPVTDRLFNVWVNEHDVGHLAGNTPLLVLDIFEHAYVTDYGIKRADYIDAFMHAVDWGKVNERFQK